MQKYKPHFQKRIYISHKRQIVLPGLLLDFHHTDVHIHENAVSDWKKKRTLQNQALAFVMFWQSYILYVQINEFVHAQIYKATQLY